METVLRSVGIDIGTTTTQIVFSRLTMANVAGAFSVPRIEIVDKTVIYNGKIHFTPLLTPARLDAEKLYRIIKDEYAQAGFFPSDMDTGAVIITGEAARKENARAIVDMTSNFAGDFVVASAGPDLESVIAGKGAGADRLSAEEGSIVVNLDIGGGTTNIAVFGAGELVSVGCYDIGGRLVRLAGDDTVAYVAPKAALAAETAGARIRVGERADAREIARLAEEMNNLLEQALGLVPPGEILEKMETPGSSHLVPPIRPDAIGFSGGVADCVYNPGGEAFPYGDMGALLGRAIAGGRLPTCARLVQTGETIRATVVGAGSYATTVSGSTIQCANDVLPRKNLMVYLPGTAEEEALYRGDADLFENGLEVFQAGNDGGVAIGLRGLRNPRYDQIRMAAAALAEALDRRLPFSEPAFVAVREDMAKALGRCLDVCLGGRRQVVCLDGITLRRGDYLDLGEPVMDGTALPVVIKTLVFGHGGSYGN